MVPLEMVACVCVSANKLFIWDSVNVQLVGHFIRFERIDCGQYMARCLNSVMNFFCYSYIKWKWKTILNQFPHDDWNCFNVSDGNEVEAGCYVVCSTRQTQRKKRYFNWIYATNKVIANEQSNRFALVFYSIYIVIVRGERASLRGGKRERERESSSVLNVKWKICPKITKTNSNKKKFSWMAVIY